ncbi:unnamed protein product, partial [Meganyctiphanes norvegica]
MNINMDYQLRSSQFSVCSTRPDQDLLFRAIETKSEQRLRSCLEEDEELVKCHGGIFHVTPLHSAVQDGWVEGVKILLDKGSSVTNKNQYGQNSIHYAAKSNNVKILNLLLENHGSSQALGSRDLRGFTPLHDAAATGRTDIVDRILEENPFISDKDNQGETAAHKAARSGAIEVLIQLMRAGADIRERDKMGISAFRWLQLYSPEGPTMLLDHLLQVNSTGRNSPVLFDIEALASNSETLQCRLLDHFVDLGQTELLAHPICQVLLLVKWKRVRLLRFAWLAFTLAYIITTSYYLLERNVWHMDCEYPSKLHNESGVNQIKVGTSFVNQTKLYTAASPNCLVRITDCKIVMLQAIISLQTLSFCPHLICRLYFHGLQSCKNFYCLFTFFYTVLFFVEIICSWHEGSFANILEQHLAPVLVLLLGTKLMLLLRKYPSHGVYVAMFIRVAQVFLKVFFIYLCLLLSFTVTLSLAFKDKLYRDIGHSFLKSLTMMVGEVDYDDDLVDIFTNLPFTSHIVFFIFVLLISVVLSNLLVGLAVSDIRELRSKAQIMRLASMVEAIVNIEQMHEFPLLRRLTRICNIKLKTTQIRLYPRNDPENPTVVVNHRIAQAGVLGSWLAGKLRKPRQYNISISRWLQEQVLLRLAVRGTPRSECETLGNTDTRAEEDTRTLCREVLTRLINLERAITS